MRSKSSEKSGGGHAGVSHTTNTALFPGGDSLCLLPRNQLEEQMESNMDYNWLTTHDPMTIDANLAEIDFDDFKNEDIQNAYAYSLQSFEDACSSGTDMSICKSEVLFSSYKEGPQESLIQDSLTAEDFKYCSEGIAVNKNNYTLTFSHNQSNSITGQSTHNPDFPHTHGGSLPNKEDISDKYTTWSNMVRQKDGAGNIERGRFRYREENSINNNMDSSKKSRSLPNISKDKPSIKHAWQNTEEEEEKFQREILNDEPSLIALYLQQRGGDRNSWGGTGHYDCQSSHDSSVSEDLSGRDLGFVKDNDQKPMLTMHGIKNKDAINNFLKTATKLTSIEEASENSSLGATRSSGGDSSDGPTVKHPIPTPRRLGGTGGSSSRSSMSTTPSLASNMTNSKSNEQGHKNSKIKTPGLSKGPSGDLPTLDFLENDVGVWDAFFMHRKNSSKFPGVLAPQLPVDQYLAASATRTGKTEIKDVNSLRVLLPNSQKHLVPSGIENDSAKSSPIRQMCDSLSHLNCSGKQQQVRDWRNQHEYGMRSSFDQESTQGPTVVQVKEAWVPVAEQVQGYVPNWDSYQRQSDQTSQLLKLRQSPDSNLNLLNNNKSTQEEKDDKITKRRSYHPQDFLSKVLTGPSPTEENILINKCQKINREFGIPKSGSYGNLCDSWQETEDMTPTSGSNTPVQTNSQDITEPNKRRGGSGNSLTSIRNLPAEYPFQANLALRSQSINFDLTHKRGLFVSLYASVERLLLYQDQSNPGYSSKAACRCILLHEFCPALHKILEDGLKEEVITSFGRMKTSVWKMIEAVMQAGPAQRNTCDLVMVLNTKFSSEEDFKKFSGFVIGLLNMSCLHIWFAKLKWSLDVLLRFYERHAFICSLHKETKLLFDELNFCLQRLYSIPFHIDMPFNDSILEEITSAEVFKKREHCNSCACTRTPTTGSEGSSCVTSGGSAASGRTSRSSKSRIPRPISLPKRLEEKLSVRASSSPPRAASAGVIKKRATGLPDIKRPLKSPATKPVVPPKPKTRVKDTVKIFDAKSNRGRTADPGKIIATTPTRSNRRPGYSATSPKTGGGEAMVDFDSGGDPFR